MIFVKKLDNNSQGHEFALWQCGRCKREMRFGLNIGRNRNECHQCAQQMREKENYKTVSLLKGDYKLRTCLMCGKLFESMGKQNRRCPKCEPAASFVDANYSRNRANKTSDGQVLRARTSEYSENEYIKAILYGDPQAQT
mgnify:CR=1 FL=1